ncbi:acyl-CoA N-acyltransferase [Corynespora cassiicola Philippines]|uniref:Acyl-CoA N-acyltransferase n=1 Tax=Corynespora cassiicola Philippines TaxID=1448308 RepID=A0A2T2NWC6_CORCC|nr:acyl-CoA N-acyltransferase [Corynespora cassiicola Philippines]
MIIREVTESDIPWAAEVAAAAYIDDEQDAFMFPNRKSYPERYLKTKESIVRHGIKDKTATVIVSLVEEGDEGWNGEEEISGFCIWYRDGDNQEEEEVQPKETSLLSRMKSLILDSEIMSYISDVFDPLVSASNAATMARTCRSPSSNYYFTSHDKEAPAYGIMDIAVHPKHQGRGIARKLVEWGMRKAREEGLPIELSATPAGSKLYKKLGFEKIGVWRWKPGMEGNDGLGGWDIMMWWPNPKAV